MLDSNDMRGALTLTLNDRAGNTVHTAHYKNRIVADGRRLVAELFSGVDGGVPPSKVTHMAVGTDNTATDDATPTLIAERSPRKAISNVDYSEITESGIKRIRARLTCVFDFADANGAEPLREAGIFTANTNGTLYSRVVFDDVTKTDAFKLTLLWDIVF